MLTVLTASNLIAIGLLLVMAAGITMNQRGKLAALLALQFFLMSVYLSLAVLDYQAIHPLLSFAVARVSSLIPAVIWLIAYHLFRARDGRVPVYIWYLFAFYVLTRALGVALLNLGILSNSTPYYLMFIFLPQVIMLGLSAHSIYIAVSDFRSDLIELRRKSRVIFVVTVALFILLTRVKTWIVYNSVVQGISSETIVTPLLDELITFYALVFSVVFFLICFRTHSQLDSLFNNAGQLVQGT